MRTHFLTAILFFLTASFSPRWTHAQTLGFYGGAGISADRFSFDSRFLKKEASASLQTGPLAIIGFRYHTEQDFDILLDASLGIVKIKIPMPDGFEGKYTYQQIQSLIMAGSGINIPVQKANLFPYIQIGASFLDFWGVSLSSGSGAGYSSVQSNVADFKSNRWSVVCGAGIDYQFRLFLSSGINFRLILMPLDVFKEPAVVSYAVNGHPYDISLQGKLMQAQLTYRVNLPVKF